MSASIDIILEEIGELSIDDQEMLNTIVQKRLIDNKRNAIQSDYETALLERQQGQIKSGSVSDLFESI